MKSVDFRLLFISIALLLVSSCNSVTNESVMSINTSEKTANEIDIELDDTKQEYHDTTSNIYLITNHNDVSEVSDVSISGMQSDIPKEYLGLDGCPLVIPAKEEWMSFDVLDNSGEEYDSGSISGIYNNGITYFLNGESYIRFPTGYQYCVSNEKTNDIDLFKSRQFETKWEKVSVGDMIGTLKIERAYAVYSYFEQLDAFLWTDIELLFSGETVLDGYLKKYSSDDVMYPNEIHFIPSINSLKENEFPLLCNSRTKEGSMNCFKFYFKDHCICGDTTEISINSLSNSVFEELSEALNNQGFCIARVTLSNIKLKGWVENVDNNRYCSADLIEWNTETTAPETSAKNSIVSSNSERPEPIETQDDFSDIIELMKQSSEGFDQIAERAFHTEIKNDMEMEEIISLLMDRYIICTNTYDVRTLFDWDFDEQFEYLDHTYYKMQHRYFNTLAEMEDFVRGTFTHEWAEIWISTSSSTDSSNTYVPRFIQKEDGIYFCIPDYVFIPPPSFLDNHIIEIKECSEMECVFSYNANIDLKRYKQMCEVTGEISWPESAFLHEGKIVLEDGEWKIDSISPAAF